MGIYHSRKRGHDDGADERQSIRWFHVSYFFDSICLGFRADDVEQVAHGQVDVHQVQPPVGQDVGADSEVARDVVDARVRRISVDRDLEVARRVLVRRALGRQQAGHAHKRRVDRNFGHDPRLGLRCAGDRAAIVRRYACSSPLPPASAAGFVHAAAIFASGTLPNSVLAGGGTVERNDAKEMRQPSCDAVRHSGMCWKAPPTSLPFGTARPCPSGSPTPASTESACRRSPS